MKILKSFRTIFVICIIIAVSAIAFSGIYSTNNIDKLSYVLALGIDVGKNNNIELSVQLAKPGGSSEKSGSSSQSSNNIVNSIECSSIESGINLFNSYISKKLNMGHCKVIVFSEEVASKGLSTYLYTLLNSVEVSSQANIVVSKCSAKSFWNILVLYLSLFLLDIMMLHQLQVNILDILKIFLCLTFF